jgi:hypothetical protein
MPEGEHRQWDDHRHDKVVHTHAHIHVTHNHNKMTGAFDHLSSEHEHEHDHPAIEHAHWPHQNFESEHRGEAHVHDHGEPVKAERAPARKSAEQAAKRATKKR